MLGRLRSASLLLFITLIMLAGVLFVAPYLYAEGFTKESYVIGATGMTLLPFGLGIFFLRVIGPSNTKNQNDSS